MKIFLFILGVFVLFVYWIGRPDKCSCGNVLTDDAVEIKKTPLKETLRYSIDNSQTPFVETTYEIVKICKKCQKVLSIMNTTNKRDATKDDLDRRL